MTKIGVIKNGLRSLYKTSKGKIDTKSLGWIRPDGKINFQSEETALNYAKNRALQGLNAPIPYEKGAIIKGNTVIADIKGSGNVIDLRKMNLAELKDTTVIHGHPKPMPLSIYDLSTMLITGQKAIYAINKSGEYSKFTKLPSIFEKLPFKKLREYLIKSERRGTVILAQKAYTKVLKPVTKKIMTIGNELNEELRQLLQKSDEKTKKLIMKHIQQFKKDCYINTSQMPEDIKPFFEKLKNTDNYETKLSIPVIHRFWLKKAEDFGVKYETNFSNLV